ncbi:MAG: cellulase family glycosylhydrolase [Bacteroidales bacterium]
MKIKICCFTPLIKRVVFLFLFWLLLTVSVKAQLPTAQEIAGKMKLGWNLGNMLEAVWIPATTFSATTQTTIDSVKAAGFNTVRLPAAWFYHSDTVTSEIDPAWLAHVKKTVDYCIRDSMYVVLNAHWDKGWLENRINAANKDIVNARQHAYWTQIANYFKDYNEYLLFAGSNEPNADDSIEMAILLSYHQTFVDAVRATGGNNSSRTLIIQGPSTNIELSDKLMNTLPTDTIANRLMVEVHYYSPWQFCGLSEDASWGKMFYYWGNGYHSITDLARNATWGEESEMDISLGLMKTKYVDKGIPVIIGEYGAFRKQVLAPSIQALHNASIEYFYRYFVKSATDKGLIPYCWDTGGLFNFTTGKVKDKVVVNAIIKGATDTIPVTNVSINELVDSLPIGATTTLTATVLPTDATYKTVTWRSINPSVASVSSSGLVTGLKVGRTIIYANADLKNAGILITVGIPATGVTVDPRGDTIKIRETRQLVATVMPSNASEKTVSWSSSQTKVATVNSSGLVTAVSKGSSVITATTTDGSFRATCRITVSGDTLTSAIFPIKPDDIAIFPNPLNGKQLTVDLGGLKEMTTIQFIEMGGQTVLEQAVVNKRRTQLDVNLKPGIYMIRFSNNQNTLLKKLVIN